MQVHAKDQIDDSVDPEKDGSQQEFAAEIERPVKNPKGKIIYIQENNRPWNLFQ